MPKSAITRYGIFLALCPVFIMAAMPDDFPYRAYDGYNPSARSVAMGGAGLCSRKDSAAIYFNPACLYGGSNVNLFSFKVRQSPKELSNENDILSGRSLIFLGFRGGGMGLSWQPLYNMRSSLTPGTTIEVKVNKFTMAFSNRISGPVDFGMNINYFSGYMGIMDDTGAHISDANGYSIDWGLIYRAHPSITFAYSLFNSPASVRWSGYGSDDPPVVTRTGAQVKLSRLLEVSAETETRRYSAPGKGKVKILHIGIEQSIMDIIFFRAGMFGEDLNDNKKTGYSAGIGWYQDKVNVDISWKKEYPATSDTEFLNTYFFSVNTPF